MISFIFRYLQIGLDFGFEGEGFLKNEISCGANVKYLAHNFSLPFFNAVFIELRGTLVMWNGFEEPFCGNRCTHLIEAWPCNRLLHKSSFTLFLLLLAV